MQLTYEFTVPVPPSEAWRVLLDLERVVPCLPGAALTSFDGDAFAGTVRVKLGPVNLTYQGKGRFVSRDEEARRVVIEASGREARGAGTASATATMSLNPGPDDGSTAVTVEADLTVTGKPAQFGRGMIADVGGKLVGQFADCLRQRLSESAASSPGVAAVTETTAEPGRPPPDTSAPLDLLQVSAGPVARRVGPYAIAFLAGMIVAWRLRRRR